jgi:hypothetical protein
MLVGNLVFRLQTGRTFPFAISKSNCLLPLFKPKRCPRFNAHRLFLCGRRHSRTIRIGQPWLCQRRTVSHANVGADADTNVLALGTRQGEPSVLFASAFVVARYRG